MAIPDFQSITLPMLQFAADGREHSLAEAREHLAQKFGLTDAERAEMLPSGRQRRFDNRVAWTKTYLEAAGLLTSPRKGHLMITGEGRKLLAEAPARIDIKLLLRYPEFREFRNSGKRSDSIEPQQEAIAEVSQATPDEIMEEAYQAIRSELAAELLSRIKSLTPQFFEKLIVELLLKMGYGGKQAGSGRAIGKSGDEGIDGIISEDRLGLENIYIQAKKWEGIIGRPEIQKFVGALHGKRARKGIFITTSGFSAEAREYVTHIDPRVVLIDGVELANYMIDFNLGVTVRHAYEVKRIDSDYFSEE